MKSGLITKIIKFILVVIIPLTAGTLWGVAAYGDYEDRYFDYYMEMASDENTEDRLVSYLTFLSEKVESEKKDEGYEFYFTEKFSNEHGDLFTFSIIRSYKVVEEPYYNKKGTKLGDRDTYYITYYMAVYDVNYETLAKTLDPTGEHALLYTQMPVLYFSINEKDETANSEENKKLEVKFNNVSNQENESLLTNIYDYGYAPEKDSKGNELNGENPTSIRFYALSGSALQTEDPYKPTKLYESGVKIDVIVKSAWGEDATEESEVVATVEKDDFYSNIEVTEDKEIQKEFKKFANGYNRDVYAAGYAKYSITRHVWWQVLLTVLIVEVVCGSFVLVWGSEAEKAKKEQQKK